MSELSISQKSIVIRNETQEYANTKKRVADVIDDINSTKANKTDVDNAIQVVIDELGITEAELYDYIDLKNNAQDNEINKKINKPNWNGTAQQFIVVSSDTNINLQPITLALGQVPYWNDNTFYNSPIYIKSGRVGIGTDNPTKYLDINGSLKSNDIFLPENEELATANRLRSDGSSLFYADDNSIEREISFVTPGSLISTGQINNWNTAYTNSHTHDNKAVLDTITSTQITNWDKALQPITGTLTRYVLMNANGSLNTSIPAIGSMSRVMGLDSNSNPVSSDTIEFKAVDMSTTAPTVQDLIAKNVDRVDYPILNRIYFQCGAKWIYIVGTEIS